MKYLNYKKRIQERKKKRVIKKKTLTKNGYIEINFIVGILLNGVNGDIKMKIVKNPLMMNNLSFFKEKRNCAVSFLRLYTTATIKVKNLL